MGKGGCGRSSSSLTSGQARRAATTVLRGGGGGGGGGWSTATFHGGGGGAPAPLLGAGAPAGDGDGKAAADDEIEWRDDAAYKYEPRHNAQPGAHLPVMRLEGGAVKDGGRFLIQTMRWGLVRPGSLPAPFARSTHPQRARVSGRDSAPIPSHAAHRLTAPAPAVAQQLQVAADVRRRLQARRQQPPLRDHYLHRSRCASNPAAVHPRPLT